MQAAPAPDLAQRVFEQTGGNALFVTEIGRAAAAKGSDVLVAIPRTLQDLIQQRVQQLPQACRGALRIAAVVGQIFCADVVAALAAPCNGESLPEMLQPAVRARLVTPDPWFGRRWHFVHALLRDAILATIDETQRRALHRAVAEAVEQRGKTEGTSPAPALRSA